VLAGEVVEGSTVRFDLDPGTDGPVIVSEREPVEVS
jgi:hypothetical protein